MDDFDEDDLHQQDGLPPEADYKSREALMVDINTWAAPRGYAFTTIRSTTEKGGRKVVTVSCDRGHRPPDGSRERIRSTATRGKRCPYSVLAKESPDKTTWSLRHRQDSRFAIHNHRPSLAPSAHPAHRQLTEADKASIKILTNAGIMPKHVTTVISQTSTSIVTQQAIYNHMAEVRRERLKGQSSIHALAAQLKEEGFWHELQVSTDNRVTGVLFAHPESLEYLFDYPSILLLDCTYKTNMYNMPLLDLVGVDACGRSFCIGFAFLSGESEEDYLWALNSLSDMYQEAGIRHPAVVLTDRCLACMNAVSTVFPTAALLLCMWHINKAVLAYCQPAFMKDNERGMAYEAGKEAWDKFYNNWHTIVHAEDEFTFEIALYEMEQRYSQSYPREVTYLKETWLDPYKEKLVKAWVDQHCHFNNVVTSRAEGIHSLLKSHLGVSKLNLFDAWRVIYTVVEKQLKELQTMQAMEQDRTPLKFSRPIYQAVHSWVSYKALRLVEGQFQRILDHKEDLPPCTGIFQRTQGLPCAHTILNLERQEQVLSQEHFHSQWHLRKRKQRQRLLLEPRPRFSRITTASSLPKSSNRRDPSLFERVEAASRPRAQPQCSRCHQKGHIRTSKACPYRFEAITASASIPEPRPWMPIPPQVSPIASPAITPVQSPNTTPAHSPGSYTSSSHTITVHVATDGSRIHTEQTTTVTRVPSPDNNLKELMYSHPLRIFSRYKKARDAWYMTLPSGALKLDQGYRRAVGLPARYSKISYTHCLDWKQMGSKCTDEGRPRDWSKEEMMAYIDFQDAQDLQAEATLAEEMRNQPFSARRGMQDIWQAAAREVEAEREL